MIKLCRRVQQQAFFNDHGNGNPSNDVVHVAHQLIAAPVAGLFWDPVQATAASALEPEIRAATAEGRASVLQEQLRTAETRIGELQEQLFVLQEQLRTADVRAAVAAEAQAAAEARASAAEARAAADVRAAAAEARAAVAEARASAVVLAAAAGRTGGPLLPQD